MTPADESIAVPDIVGVRLTLLARDPAGGPINMDVGDRFEIPLRRGEPIMVGRIPVADFRIEAASVGRRVLSLELRAPGVWVTDYGSGGGSALEINGVVTSNPSGYVPEGSILHVGSIPFRVEFLYRD